jgi:ABC-type transporter Mla maintaining outer membrane lipid asymmetry ATPase subunit MlaF
MAFKLPESFVELRNVTFGYGERVILDNVSLNVPRGKITALMGASGGGKTTILRLIGGQNRAQSGQMLFDGQDVTHMDQSQVYAARRRMGMLYQFGALFADMSVFDNVAFPLREHTESWRGHDSGYRAHETQCRRTACRAGPYAQRACGWHGAAGGAGPRHCIGS